MKRFSVASCIERRNYWAFERSPKGEGIALERLVFLCIGVAQHGHPWEGLRAQYLVQTLDWNRSKTEGKRARKTSNITSNILSNKKIEPLANHLILCA